MAAGEQQAWEVPFETAGQIEERLLQYEELFKGRYTKDDAWHASTVQREQRWYNVPQIDPWPPHQCISRRRQYKDMDERQDGHRSRNRERDFGNRERGRGHYDSWRRSPRPHHDRNYYDRPPSNFRGHRGHSRGHSPSPPYAHYPRRSKSRSPLQQQQGRSPGRPGSSPWRQGSSPRRPGSFPRRQEGDYNNEDELQSNGPLPLERAGSFPWKQENRDESEVMSSGPLPPPLPRPHSQEEVAAEEEKTRSLVVPLDIKEVADFEEEVTDKAVPSQSDVLDILNTASFGVNVVNFGNLKQVQKETSAAAKKPKAIKKKRTSSSSYLLDAFPPVPVPVASHAHHHHDHTSPPPQQVSVSHGRPQDVSVQKPPPRKRPKLSPIITTTETGTTATAAATTTTATATTLKHSKGHRGGKSSKVKGHDKSSKVKSHERGSKSKKKLKSQHLSARSVLCGETQHSAVSQVNPTTPSYAAAAVTVHARRHQPCISSSSSEEGDVDVTTPINTDISLSICLKKSLIGVLDSDTTGRQHAPQTSQPPPPPRERGGATAPLTVSIDRKRIKHRSSTPPRRHDDIRSERSAALAELSEPRPPLRAATPPPGPAGAGEADMYRVELGSTSNKLIFRVGSADGGVAVGVAGGVAVDKKSKKKHKKKSKHSKKAKTRHESAIEAGAESQDTSRNYQDTSLDTTSRNYQDTSSLDTSRNYQDTSLDTSRSYQDTGVDFQDTDGQDIDGVWITETSEPLKVKIKIPSQ